MLHEVRARRSHSVDFLSIEFFVKVGEYVEKSVTKIAEIMNSDGYCRLVTSSISGWIESMSSTEILKNRKELNVSVCAIRECGHEEVNETTVKSMSVCKKCGSEVWV